jgi:large subunit ribosomal protein L3
MLELLGKKIGMTHLFAENGDMVPLTMLQVYDNAVLNFAVNEGKEFDSLSLSFVKSENSKKIAKPQAGVFAKKSLPLFKKVHGSKVSKGLIFNVGDAIAVDQVVAQGDKINVTAFSTGKGFAGPMKRWNFAGLEASHGVSVSHRSHGSTGQRQDPGKVFKGKKMAGHLGVEKVTIRNLEVVLIDKENSVVGLKGAVPGKSGIDVVLKIAKNF